MVHTLSCHQLSYMYMYNNCNVFTSVVNPSRASTDAFLFKGSFSFGPNILGKYLCTCTWCIYIATCFRVKHRKGFAGGVASSPGLLREEGREGLVSTACACVVIIQILNNPIAYGHCLVHLPFDLNLPCSMKASKQRGHVFSAIANTKVRRSSCILWTISFVSTR